MKEYHTKVLEKIIRMLHNELLNNEDRNEIILQLISIFGLKEIEMAHKPKDIPPSDKSFGQLHVRRK